MKILSKKMEIRVKSQGGCLQFSHTEENIKPPWSVSLVWNPEIIGERTGAPLAASLAVVTHASKTDQERSNNADTL